MIRSFVYTKALLAMFFLSNMTYAQEVDVSKQIKDQVGEIGSKVNELGKTIETVPAVQDASAGLLQPIYQAAEAIDFPSFYWVAFALMVAGVVSFAGQLLFSKLLLLMRMKLDVKEVLSDILGFLISAIGLILTTQAATQNSTFTESPFMVLSAAIVGALIGFVFYLWGQSTEFKAARKQKIIHAINE